MARNGPARCACVYSSRRRRACVCMRLVHKWGQTICSRCWSGHHELLETHEDCERCEEIHLIGRHTVALP